MRRILLLMTVAVMVLSLVACQDDTPSQKQTESEVTSNDANTPDRLTSLPNTDGNTDEADTPTHTNAEFYGSFLTMEAAGDRSELESSYFTVLTDYSEIEQFYNNGSDHYIYGKKFTIAMASFNDDFMSDHDVLILVINEPSTYITHDSADIEISGDTAVFEVSRIIVENATMSDTYYHLVFIGGKGAFDKVKGLDLNVDITETVTKEKYAANDAEIYLYSYPEFWPFVYRTSALSNPMTEIDTIESYDELIGYYEQHKDNYELDSFKKHIGSLYDESLFNDYILLMVLLPYDDSENLPEIDELFVYNSEIYISIGNSSDAIVSSTTSSCLLATAVSKSDLQGVNLRVFNISFN